MNDNSYGIGTDEEDEIRAHTMEYAVRAMGGMITRDDDTRSGELTVGRMGEAVGDTIRRTRKRHRSRVDRAE